MRAEQCGRDAFFLESRLFSMIHADCFQVAVVLVTWYSNSNGVEVQFFFVNPALPETLSPNLSCRKYIIFYTATPCRHIRTVAPDRECAFSGILLLKT